MEPKRVLIIAAMLIAAVILFLQVRKMGTPAKVPVPEAEVVNTVEYSQVLTSTGEIPFGHRLTEEDMQWKDWPTEALSPDYLTEESSPDALSEYVGGISRSVVYSDEPITAKKIVLPGTQGMMAAILSPGMRAVAARVSAETTAGGFIQPGDYVDIIMTSSKDYPDQNNGNIRSSDEKIYFSSTVFVNVKVLAVDQIYSSDPEATGAAIIGSTATFEMTQGDAELLRQAEEQGDLTLTLRPISDSSGMPGQSTARMERSSVEKDKGPGVVSVYRYGDQKQVSVRGQ